MKFKESKLKGLFIIEPTIYLDSRGYFFESFNNKNFEENTGLKINFLQDNESKSQKMFLEGYTFKTILLLKEN